MLRAILAVVLLLFIGGLGYYFVTYSGDTSPEEEMRARTEPVAPGPPPQVSTGTGAAPDLPRSTDAVASAPPPAEAGPGQAPALPRTETPLPGPAQSAASAGADPGPLASRQLGMPVANVKPSDLHDMFNQSRGGGERQHEATDIMAAKGTPVLAVDNGIVKKLFTSKPGGLTIYQYDPQEKYAYYYAHLDRYAEGIREGLLVKRGDVIGYVGVTGNSDPNAPHLHFAILELGPEKKWYEDTKPVNPYPLLSAQLNAQMSKRKKK